MSTLKRWATGATVGRFLLLAGQTSLAAQQSTPPASGKALAAQIGLSDDAAAKLTPQLDALLGALKTQSRARDEAVKASDAVRTALADVAPALTPEQRQRLWSALAQTRGAGAGMGYGMHAGAPGMGYGMSGQGMRGTMPGGGMMGGAMHGGAMHGGPGAGGMGPGMHGGAGGMAGSCPFCPAADSAAAGAGNAPGAGAGAPPAASHR